MTSREKYAFNIIWANWKFIDCLYRFMFVWRLFVFSILFRWNCYFMQTFRFIRIRFSCRLLHTIHDIGRHCIKTTFFSYFKVTFNMTIFHIVFKFVPKLVCVCYAFLFMFQSLWMTIVSVESITVANRMESLGW